MNIKINTICFIILLFLLIGVASATSNDNETLKQTIEQPDEDISQKSVDNYDTLKASNENNDKLELSLNTTEKLGKSLVDTGKLEKSKEVRETLKLSISKTSIKSSDMKIHYKDGSKFTVTLKDSSKKAVKKAKVSFTINEKTYTKTTDSKGKASLTLNLNSGKYTITTSFQGSSKYYASFVKNTITVKSTIKSKNLEKYYKNKAAFYSTFYDKKGKLLKDTAVKFKINSKTYSVKTNKKGVAKLSIDLKPGFYGIHSINSKTSETAFNIIKIYSLLETKDMTMNESDKSKFSVKLLNSNGKVSPNKIVTIKVNGKTYSPKSNTQGIASQVIDLPAGKYSITTEYEGLKNTNTLIVNKVLKADPIKKSEFVHTTVLPNYVNVTIPYAFHNSAYTLKIGTNGTVKMPKIEVFTVEIGSKIINLATGKTNVEDVLTMEEKNYLIPSNGYGMMICENNERLPGEGIQITRTPTSTEISYKGLTKDNIELFGFYASKNTENSETFTYMINDKVVGKVTVRTHYFDEKGVKYSLAKLYNRVNTDFNYYEITNHVKDPVIFTNTGKAVTYSYFTNYIAGYQTKEDMITKFTINGKEELEKVETISYGHADKYGNIGSFEVLQSYSIINKKITGKILEDWILKKSSYQNNIKSYTIYGMFLSGLETCWLSDETANTYAKEFNVNWERVDTSTILGGINLDETYLHILNADMGMKVEGNPDNAGLFRLFNSLNLPNIEDYVLKQASSRYSINTSNSLNNVLYSIASNNYSISQIGETIYLFGQDNSAIILNTTSGLSNVILSTGKATYKGSSMNTREDSCSICNLANDITNGAKNTWNKFKSGINKISELFDKNHPLSMLAYHGIKTAAGALLTGVPKVALGLFNTMSMVQTAGVTYRTGIVDEKDWHSTMDTYTFTRAGYLQGKKVYNIPNKNGGYDYVEVGINKDLTLNRNDVKYISQGQTKKLTKQESYQYFSDEYWSPFSMPQKYWDQSWK